MGSFNKSSIQVHFIVEFKDKLLKDLARISDYVVSLRVCNRLNAELNFVLGLDIQYVPKDKRISLLASMHMPKSTK